MLTFGKQPGRVMGDLGMCLRKKKALVKRNRGRCCRCEKRFILSRGGDPDFCRDCVERIDWVVDNRLELARGATMLASSQNRRERVSLFLSVFHPEMSGDRHRRVLSAVIQDNR